MAEELNNPLFEDEREFLERKKQEYERALRGDVDHIKDQSVQVGKVALVGAGLAGSIWLISKVFGGKGKAKSKAKDKNKKRKEATGSASHSYQQDRHANTYLDFDDDEDFDLDDEAFSFDRSAEGHDHDEHSDFVNERRHDNHFAGASSARESARAFMAHDNEHDQQQLGIFDHNDNLDGDERSFQSEDDDQSYGTGFDHAAPHDELPAGRLDFGPNVHLHKQGIETTPIHAYDDSRRLPKSADFSAENSASSKKADYDAEVPWPAPQPQGPTLGQRVTGMAKSFLDTNTGKAVAAQAAAVVLAYVSKKINDRLPVKTTDKNADLANAPATTAFYAVPPAATDSSPAVSLTYTDAPTEHPAS